MYANSDPVFHRDIHWQNIIQMVQNPSKWFIIDWEDASMLPTHTAKNLKKREHLPGVFSDEHGAEMDIWAICKLFLDASTFVSPLSAAMVSTGNV
jgi:hypothetical protein